jgi:hypothetical protein
MKANDEMMNIPQHCNHHIEYPIDTGGANLRLLTGGFAVGKGFLINTLIV